MKNDSLAPRFRARGLPCRSRDALFVEARLVFVKINLFGGADCRESAYFMERQCDLLLQAEWVICQDRERTVIQNGAVIVQGKTILDVGPFMRLATSYEPKHTINLGKSLLMPGLINAHTHSPMTVFRGAADDMPLIQWLETHIWPLEAKLSEEIIHLGSLMACAEMLRTGTTCFLDMYFHQRHTARAVEQSGMRAVLAEGLLDFATLSYANAEEALVLIESLLEEYAEHERVRFAVAPHAVFSSHQENLVRSFELAGRYEALWFTHCAESAAVTAQAVEKYGLRPVEVLRELGLLSSRTGLVHMVDLTDEEIELVAASGAHVILCPISNMKLASGIARGADLAAAGVSLSLGTDGAASNNTLNMFREMRACALLHKVASMDPTALPAQQVLDMATVNGAACLGWQGLGSLAPGHPADCVALNLAEPNMQPLHSPLSQVVYAAGGHEVRLAMVGGRVLYQDGVYHSLDYEALVEEFTKVRLWAQKHLD